MIAAARRLNATHRCSPSRGEEGARPLARSPGQIGHCAIPVDRNDGPAALHCLDLTIRILSAGRAALTPSAQAPISNLSSVLRFSLIVGFENSLVGISANHSAGARPG